MGHSGQKMLGPLSFILLTLASSGLSLVPITGFPNCLTNPLYLVPDPEDCHIFYQCDLNPHPMSCGDMMFNSHRQVCDWPSAVLQLRPECRKEEQLRFTNTQFPYHRTLRMLNFFREGNLKQQKPHKLSNVNQKSQVLSKNMKNSNVNYEQKENFGYAKNSADKKLKTNNEHIGKQIVKSQFHEPSSTDNVISNIKKQVLLEIRKRLPEVVEHNIERLNTNSIVEETIVGNENVRTLEDSKEEAYKEEKMLSKNHKVQANSLPADTVRLTPHSLVLGPSPVVGRPTPTPYREIDQDSIFTAPVLIKQNELQTVDYSNSETVQGTPKFDETSKLPLANTSKEPNPTDVNEAKNQPQPAPILIEDTRNFKPVWTVTRERPQQIILKYRNHNPAPCSNKSCRRQRVLKKIRRKLLAGEKQQLETRRRELLQGGKAAENSIITLGNQTKAITLDEAYKKTLRKPNEGETSRKEPGNLLHEILNRDFESKTNANNLEFGAKIGLN